MRLCGACRFRFISAATGALLVVGCGLSDDDRAPPIGTLYGEGDPEPAALECDIAVGEPGCAPPQLLIVLDRSTSMAALSDGAYPRDADLALVASKWALAIEALANVTRSELGQRISFGLELFPRDPGEEDYCVPIAEVVTGAPKWSSGCREGTLLVAPCPLSGAAIGDALDLDTTTLCGDTPMGAALDTAREVLAAMRTPYQEQYVLFVTDGADTCRSSRPAVDAARQLAADGVGIYAVGFAGGDVDPHELTQISCAGGTAPEPEAQCAFDANGFSAQPDGFLVVEDGAGIEATIRAIAGEIQCAEIY
jgi:hypothetical protein